MGLTANFCFVSQSLADATGPCPISFAKIAGRLADQPYRYRAMQQAFRDIDDPETYAAEFEVVRREWNLAHPDNPNNFRVAEMRPAIAEMERLVRAEARPRQVVQDLVREMRRLRNFGFPYRDSHRLLLRAAEFLAKRNPTTMFDVADFQLLEGARTLLGPDRYRNFEQQFEALLRLKPHPNRAEKGARFRRDLLNALDEAAKDPKTERTFLAARTEVLKRAGLFEASKAELEKLQRAIAGRVPTAEESAAISALRMKIQDYEAWVKSDAAGIRYATDDRRRLFYENLGTNKEAGNTRLLEFKLRNIVDHVVIPTPGFVPIRALVEARINRIHTVAIVRKPGHVDGDIFNAAQTIIHDSDHIVAEPLTAKLFDQLPLSEKRGILISIDQLPSARQRELADYGMLSTLHEQNVELMRAPDDVTKWKKAYQSHTGKTMTADEQAWLYQWMKVLHQRLAQNTP